MSDVDYKGLSLISPLMSVDELTLLIGMGEIQLARRARKVQPARVPFFPQVRTRPVPKVLTRQLVTKYTERNIYYTAPDHYSTIRDHAQ